MITVEGGFPHSEIFGSKLVRSSPKLNAAYHVLHRLLAPRHPPNALKTLDRSHSRCPLQIPLGRVELQTNLKSAIWTVNIEIPVFLASIMLSSTRSGNGCPKTQRATDHHDRLGWHAAKHNPSLRFQTYKTLNDKSPSELFTLSYWMNR